MNTGKIVQIIGAVVDVDFSQSEMPSIYNALTVEYEVDGKPNKLVLEVEQHLTDGWARTVAMSSTDGLKRGMTVVDTGAPISVPVGPKVLGRIFNVLGETVDEKGQLDDVKRYPIHREAPTLEEQTALFQELQKAEAEFCFTIPLCTLKYFSLVNTAKLNTEGVNFLGDGFNYDRGFDKLSFNADYFG